MNNSLLREKAYAKLNLSLDVGRRREDGYHDLTMIMQSVSLCDELTIALDDRGILRAESNLSYVPSDDRNLAIKAARLFLRRIDDRRTGLRITIKKNIPVGSGMAGGSSDAAATLRALNRAMGRPLDREALLALAEEIGSDVPFCLLGGTMLAEGRGDLLSPLPPMPPCHIAIAKPHFSISTPELFRKLDKVKIVVRPDTRAMLEDLENGDLTMLCRRMYNVFEDCGDRRMREVARIKSALWDLGAIGSVMTGTGSAVFGVFTDESAAVEAVKSLSASYSFCALAAPVPAAEF